MVKQTNRALEMQKTRQRIIVTAERLFMDKGYRFVTTREIAKESNITQPALYHHFKDKEMIYVAVLQAVTTDVRQGIDKLKMERKTAKEALTAYFKLLIVEHPSNLAMMVNDINSQISAENQLLLFQLWQSTYFIPMIAFFEEKQGANEIRADKSAKAMTQYTFGVLMSLVSLKIPYQTEEQLLIKVSESVDFLLEGIVR
ncbi:TetR/AcrR family transcriptional regulator [Brochothrix campestris]|uniref:Putative transcriptional regulator n=1 Tax=Brochothrix campestris FSL F6-1037 TaxID=1265861 RepID=W7CMZ7_9LIST|nr:TetR/AcrR family transcriptional regulator [Brochothrix campestris]EUJ38050.1 putative transcriptional regulator [Brochothrix campestris FSL F6-1037]